MHFRRFFAAITALSICHSAVAALLDFEEDEGDIVGDGAVAEGFDVAEDAQLHLVERQRGMALDNA